MGWHGSHKEGWYYVDVEPLPVTKRVPSEIPSTIFMSAMGAAFPSWIDEGGRSNSYDSGDLIDNPVYQIESILREAGFTSTEINVAVFDTVAPDYEETTAFSWNTQETVLAKIEGICQETGLIFFVGSDGKFAVKRIIAGADPDFELVEADFAGNDNFLVSRTLSDQLINALLLRYRYNYVKNTFDYDIELNADVNTVPTDSRSGFRDEFTSYEDLLDASRTKYNRDYKFTYEAQYCRSEGAAEDLFKSICNWHGLQRLVIEADLVVAKLTQDSSHTTLDIEIGDTCTITHTLLPGTTANIASTDSPSANAIFVVTGVVITPGPEELNVHVTFLETPFNIPPP